jgi:hypothetical protein
MRVLNVLALLAVLRGTTEAHPSQPSTKKQAAGPGQQAAPQPVNRCGAATARIGRAWNGTGLGGAPGLPAATS